MIELMRELVSLLVYFLELALAVLLQYVQVTLHTSKVSVLSSHMLEELKFIPELVAHLIDL